MAEPTCPQCAAQGMEYIRSKESTERSRSKHPWFLVIYCTACGHVYNTIAKHVLSEPVTPRFVLPKKP